MSTHCTLTACCLTEAKLMSATATHDAGTNNAFFSFFVTTKIHTSRGSSETRSARLLIAELFDGDLSIDHDALRAIYTELYWPSYMRCRRRVSLM